MGHRKGGLKCVLFRVLFCTASPTPHPRDITVFFFGSSYNASSQARAIFFFFLFLDVFPPQCAGWRGSSPPSHRGERTMCDPLTGKVRDRRKAELRERGSSCTLLPYCESGFVCLSLFLLVPAVEKPLLGTHRSQSRTAVVQPCFGAFAGDTTRRCIWLCSEVGEPNTHGR